MRHVTWFVVIGFSLWRSAFAAPLTLEEAWRIAEVSNPTFRAADARLQAFRGTVDDARSLLWNNPQLSGERVRRDVPVPGDGSDRWREWSAGVSQTFEIAGQRGYRLASAEAALEAALSEREEIRRQVRAEVSQQFYRVLVLQRRISIEEEAQTLFDRAVALVEKRRAAARIVDSKPMSRRSKRSGRGISSVRRVST